jgi:hypothetical protein
MNFESKTEFSRYTADELSELYEKDPKHFDEIAAEALDDACSGLPEDLTVKLKQMQWTIDGKLRKAKSPLERLQIMQEIFYDYVFGADGELAHLRFSCQELRLAIKGTEEVVPAKPALYLVKR